MALTSLQREVCRLIARNRVESGESYVAGGVALNELLAGDRISRDIDLFHDTEDALASSYSADLVLLRSQGFEVEALRERAGFVQARVTSDSETVLLEWARDSSYRFFPLLEHEELGLVLHPFDLATNKVLALVGRLEVRDWVDLLQCDQKLQPFGYLAWAACGKDPGFSPSSLVEWAARSGRYSQEELDSLVFSSGKTPDAGELARGWHAMLTRAKELHEVLPAVHAGEAVLTRYGDVCQLDPPSLYRALEDGGIRFHAGSIRGVLPAVR